MKRVARRKASSSAQVFRRVYQCGLSGIVLENTQAAASRWATTAASSTGSGGVTRQGFGGSRRGTSAAASVFVARVLIVLPFGLLPLPARDAPAAGGGNPFRSKSEPC